MSRYLGQPGDLKRSQMGALQVPYGVVAHYTEPFVLSHRPEDWEWCKRSECFMPMLMEHRITPGTNGVSGTKTANPIREILSHLTGQGLQVISPFTPGLEKVGSYWQEYDTTGRTKDKRVVVARLPIWRGIEAVGSSFELVFDAEVFDAYRGALVELGIIPQIDPALIPRLIRKAGKRLTAIKNRADQTGLSKYKGRVARLEQLLKEMSDGGDGSGDGDQGAADKGPDRGGDAGGAGAGDRQDGGPPRRLKGRRGGPGPAVSGNAPDA